MQRLFTLLIILLCSTLSASAQGDSPYARFGYEGKVLRTPQERQQRMMLLVPNPDTTATVAKVGLDPAKQRYYLFDKQNQVLDSDTLAGTTVSRFLSVDPLAPKYPWYTPYQFAGNTPIWATDLDGLEPYYGPQATSGYDLFDDNRDGKVSKAERQGGNQAVAFFGIAAIDMYLTRGWLSRTFLAATLGDAVDYGEKSLNARKSGNTQAAGEYSNQSKEAYTQFAVGVGMIGAGKLGLAVARRVMLSNILSSGRWVTEIESMSANSRAYQEFATGAAPNTSFKLNNVKFDGLENGVLIEAKGKYTFGVNSKTGEFHSWFNGGEGLVDQARRQLQAVKGNPIEWRFQFEADRNATQALFDKQGISGIDLKYTPMPVK